MRIENAKVNSHCYRRAWRLLSVARRFQNGSSSEARQNRAFWKKRLQSGLSPFGASEREVEAMRCARVPRAHPVFEAPPSPLYALRQRAAEVLRAARRGAPVGLRPGSGGPRATRIVTEGGINI